MKAPAIPQMLHDGNPGDGGNVRGLIVSGSRSLWSLLVVCAATTATTSGSNNNNGTALQATAIGIIGSLRTDLFGCEVPSKCVTTSCRYCLFPISLSVHEELNGGITYGPTAFQ